MTLGFQGPDKPRKNQKRDQLRKLSIKYKPQNRYSDKDGKAGIKT